MKIGVISSYACIKAANNYGALLQYFALQEYLKRRGHEVFWIRSVLPHSGMRVFLRHVKHYRRLPLLLRYYECHRKFFDFIGHYLNLSISAYRSVGELARNCPFADAYVAGSDQVWGGTAGELSALCGGKQQENSLRGELRKQAAHAPAAGHHTAMGKGLPRGVGKRKQRRGNLPANGCRSSAPFRPDVVARRRRLSCRGWRTAGGWNVLLPHKPEQLGRRLLRRYRGICSRRRASAQGGFVPVFRSVLQPQVPSVALAAAMAWLLQGRAVHCYEHLSWHCLRPCLPQAVRSHIAGRGLFAAEREDSLAARDVQPATQDTAQQEATWRALGDAH